MAQLIWTDTSAYVETGSRQVWTDRGAHAETAASGTLLTIDMVFGVESLSAIRRDAVPTPEWVSMLQCDSVPPAEMLTAFRRDTVPAAEWLTGAKIDGAPSAEILGNLQRDATLGGEVLLTVQRNITAIQEILATSVSNSFLSVEFLNSTVAVLIDTALTIEWLDAIRSNGNLLAEEVATIYGTNLQVLEMVGDLQIDAATAIEMIVAARADTMTQIESLLASRQNTSLGVEELSELQRDSLILFEALGTESSVLSDSALALEFTQLSPLFFSLYYNLIYPRTRFVFGFPSELFVIKYSAMANGTTQMPEVVTLPSILPDQIQTAGIDFGRFLPTGATLVAPAALTISVVFGADSNPASRILRSPVVATASIASGGTGVTNAAILFQIGNCLAGVIYLIEVSCLRSDGDTVAAAIQIPCDL